MKALWIGSLAIQKPAFYPVAWHVEAHTPLGIDLGVVCRCRVGTAEQPWAPQSVDESSLKVAAHVCRISCEFDTALWEEHCLVEGSTLFVRKGRRPPSGAYANMCSYGLSEASRSSPVRRRSAPGSVLPGLV
jgi:hypothetical protein